MSEPNPFLSSGSSAAGSGSAGEARAVDAGQGWAWIVTGFEMFKKQPGNWIVIVIVLFVIMMVLAFIPFLGAIATFLLMPIFTGGLMLGCRSLARDGTLEINHLFAGFSTQTGNLVALGGISIAAWIVVMLPVMAITFFGAYFGASAGGAAGMGGMGASFLLALLIVLALSILIYMALWFAPALVVLRGAAPMAAIKQSFAACLRNVIPFLVYGLVVLVLSIVATIPFGLGWLVLGPVLAASVYTAYQDIFGDA
jgi:uncharacterized membrane protein